MNYSDYEAQLACPVDIDKVDKYPDYWMEVKLDGVRCIAIKLEDKVTMWTRQANELHHKLPNIATQLQSIPGDWVLDGELGYCTTFLAIGAGEPLYSSIASTPVDMDFNATMRVIGSGPEEARLKQSVNTEMGWPNIKYVVFDMLRTGNYDLYNHEQIYRRETLSRFFDKSGDLRDIELSAIWPTWDETVYNDVVKAGGEGVMLKNPRAPYHRGKRRANSWYKVKAYNTVDCQIVDYDEGQGKYTGQIGSLIVKDPQGQEIHISGMTDEQRKDMTDHFNSRYVTKMCEVKHFGKVGKDKDGYRHPQFLRMRPDLDATI